MEKPFNALNLNDIASFLVTGKSGDEIFHAGDPGAEMYVVRQGQIELSRPARGGRTQTVLRLQAGDFFGEESLFEDQARATSARALTDYQLIRLDATVFEFIINENPGIAVQMIRSLLHRDSRGAEVHVKAANGLASMTKQAEPEESLRSSAPSREPVLVDALSGKVFPIAGDAELTVGRVSGASAFKPAIDLSELDPKRTLSRRHAHLHKRDDEVYLRAVSEARNGTFVNGRRVGAAQVRLNEGDRICFGLVETVFHYR